MDKSRNATSFPSLRPNAQQKSVSLSHSFENSQDSTKPISLLEPGTQVLTRLRQHYKRAKKVSPELAAQVISDFVLPMFNADARVRTDGKRLATFSVKRTRCNRTFDQKDRKEGLEPIPGTILGELKLSSLLHGELQTTKEEMRDIQLKAREAQQSKVSMRSQLDQERTLRLQLDADCTLLRFQLMTYERFVQQAEAKLAFISQQLEQYKEMYTRCEAERKKITNTLHEERWRNDKLKNKSVELENGYSLLQMENEIVGEKLKGMHLAIQSLSSRHFLEEKLGAEVQAIASVFYKAAESHSSTLTDLFLACKEKDKMRDDLLESNSLMSELRAERDKIGQSAKDRLISLKAELDQTREERERCKAELTRLERKYKDLGDEHDKLRQKLKHMRLKRKQYGEGEEKLCRKCQKTFMEVENFNWSCRTHKAEFGGEMWWCCGREKDAPGCLVSKHLSKDDDEDNEPRDKEEDEQRQLANLRCPSCRVLGHKASECPKDPNVRSSFDIEEELKRIIDIRMRKKQESSFEMNQLVATIYRERLRSEAYDIGYGSTPSSSVINSAEDEFEEERVPPATNFQEIQEMKSEVSAVTSCSTLFPVAQFTSKDAEKEQMINKRISVVPARSDVRKETLMQRVLFNREAA